MVTQKVLVQRSADSIFNNDVEIPNTGDNNYEVDHHMSFADLGVKSLDEKSAEAEEKPY